MVVSWNFLILPLAIKVAWLALKYWDEPVRAWLTHRYDIRRGKYIDTHEWSTDPRRTRNQPPYA